MVAEADEVHVLLVHRQPRDKAPLLRLLACELHQQAGFPITRRRADQRQLLSRKKLQLFEGHRPAHVPDRQRRLRQLCPHDGISQSLFSRSAHLSPLNALLPPTSSPANGHLARSSIIVELFPASFNHEGFGQQPTWQTSSSFISPQWINYKGMKRERLRMYALLTQIGRQRVEKWQRFRGM